MAEWIVEAETLEDLENGFYTINNNGEPVVRCKDCKYYIKLMHDDPDDDKRCENTELYEWRHPEHYCAWGERREDE